MKTGCLVCEDKVGIKVGEALYFTPYSLNCFNDVIELRLELEKSLEFLLYLIFCNIYVKLIHSRSELWKTCYKFGTLHVEI